MSGLLKGEKGGGKDEKGRPGNEEHRTERTSEPGRHGILGDPPTI